MSTRALGTYLIVSVVAVSACSNDECADTACVTALPARVDADLSGKETLVRVAVPADGFLMVAKTADSAPDTALRLLGSPDANDPLDEHSSRVAARVSAGEVFVAIDSPSGAEGSVSLQIALTTARDFEEAGINATLAQDALTVIENAWAWGATRRTEYVIVDFTQHSSVSREWVFDLATNELLWNLRVAHGRKSTNGTNLAMAVSFSNVNGSNQSSLGLFRSATPYVGTFGESFRLEGLEPSYNDNACARDIVMHPWAPVGDEYVQRCGWARPSLGCPAIDSVIAKPVRDRLARHELDDLDDGVAMLFWAPNTDWHRGSIYLNGASSTPSLETAMAAQCTSGDSTPTPPASTDYACD